MSGQSAPDSANGHRNQEAEVERSYIENCSANAQEAVDALMTNMDFLEREGDLLYKIPKGAASASIVMRACVDFAVRWRFSATCAQSLSMRLQAM